MHVSADVKTPPESEEAPSVSTLMVPGTLVWLRYRTTQHTSGSGEQWRQVHVVRYGHVAETELGYDSNPAKDGWWCVHDNVRKFFLRVRILEVLRNSSPPYIPNPNPPDY